MKKTGSFYLMVVLTVLQVLLLLAFLFPAGYFFFYEESPFNKPIGGDWRVWRGYTPDYTLSDSLTVTFSPFRSDSDDAVCYSTYDTRGGQYMGYIRVAPPDNNQVIDWNKGHFLTEDRDKDGQKEIGIRLTDGRVLWYSLCCPIEIPDGPISFPCIEEQLP